MFVEKGVAYVVRYKNMYSEMEVKVFKTPHDAAEWIDIFSEDYLAKEAEMKMEVLPILGVENKED